MIELTFGSRSLVATLSVLFVAACSSDPSGGRKPEPTPEPQPEPPAATHSALLSIQEASLVGLPQAGHGLSVRLDFAEVARAPDFEESAGGPFGCRAWVYDVALDPPPAASGDEGAIAIEGTSEALGAPCVHAAGAGYICPVGTWDLADASVVPHEQGRATYSVPNAEFTEELAVGRYLALSGPGLKNAGRYPILAIGSPTSLVVQSPQAVEETIAAGTALLLAGAGPVPNNPRNAIEGGETVTIAIEPSAGGHFDFPELTLSAGGEFRPDEATQALLTKFPIDGGAHTLSCSGPSGSCGDAAVSALSLTTTDADVTGLSPAALPPARKKQVSVLCAVQSDDGSITIPEGAARLLAAAHAESPITRIRLAYMRDGIAFASNPPPAPANPVVALVGHQVLGFTTVSP